MKKRKTNTTAWYQWSPSLRWTPSEEDATEMLRDLPKVIAGLTRPSEGYVQRTFKRFSALFFFLLLPALLFAQVPTITSFTPTSGPIGVTVTITGTNFDPIPSNNIVYFGAVGATVTAASSTTLTVTVPTGAAYQPITITNTTTGLTAFSSKPFIVTFPSSRIIDAESFATPTNFTIGANPNPNGVAIGDIDGDGKPDLVVTNGSSTVSVFRNTSASGSITASSFASKVDFTAGSYPYNVVIGDVDGDGKPDLIVVNESGNTVSVFRNTSTSGSITASSFASRVDFTTGTNPHNVAIGDVDGDGKPDLVVANWGDNAISIFRNTSTVGSITASSFAPRIDFATGSWPYVAMCDVDGDGKPDLVAANWTSNTISVFRNTSTVGSITASSFALKIDFTAEYPEFVAIGDIDGDGKPDLVVTHEHSNNVSVFRNTSTVGSITANSFASSIDFTTGTSPRSVAIGDVDGDGKPDLVVTNYGSSADGNTVSVFRNTSTSGSITASSFAPRFDFTTGTGPMDVSIGDIDGDDKPDLFVTNSNSITASILRNIMATSVIPSTVTSFIPVRNALNVMLNTAITVTFDQDVNSSTLTNSTIRINGSLSGSHKAAYNYNSSTKTITITPMTPFKYGEVVTTTLTRGIQNAAGDSLAYAYCWSFTTTVNGSRGQFMQSSTIKAGSNPNSVITGDFNGDGYLDLAINNRSDTVSILLNNGNGIFTESSTISLEIGQYPFVSGMIAGDFNGDGYLDLAVTSQSPFTVYVLLNNGNGIFTLNSTISVGSNPISIIAGDFNGDGYFDLATANAGDGTVSILLNNGNCTFTQSSISVASSNSSYLESLITGDFNGDGFLDLAVANNYSDMISILWNDGTGTFKSSSTTSSGNWANSITAGDFNGDGYLDLASVNATSRTISILLNNGNGTFTQSSTPSFVNLPMSVIAGDFNGDGFLDLAVSKFADDYSGTVSILLNNGKGAFTQSSTPSVGSYPNSLTAGDFNGDGYLDLAVVNHNSNTISILSNRSYSASLSLSSNSIPFGALTSGNSKGVYLKITNYGTDSLLVISSITNKNSVFTVKRASLTIPHDATDSVLVTFSPTISASFNDSLKIYSNDPRNPVSTVYLSGYSGNYFSGVITSNTTWTKANSPYIINGNSAVGPGVTLTIQSGVQVVFNGRYAFNVDGTLQAIGALGDTVIFTSIAPDTMKFPGITIRTGSSASFAFAKIQNADKGISSTSPVSLAITNSCFNNNTTGFTLSSTTASLTKSVFENNTTGISGSSSSVLTMSNVTLNSNGTGVSYSGSTLTADTLLVTSNTTGMNVSNTAFTLRSSTLTGNEAALTNTASSNWTIDRCTISNNAGGISSTYGTVQLTNNIITYNSGDGMNLFSLSGLVNGNTIRNNGRGIYTESNITISSNDISNNTGNGIESSASLTIQMNIIKSNGQDGINLGGNAAISYCDILNNGRDGVRTSARPTITNCNVYGNISYNLHATLQAADSILAQNNYWGTTIASVISSKIYDYYVDGVTIRVVFKPYATSPMALQSITNFKVRGTAGSRINFSWDSNPFASQYKIYSDNRTGTLDSSTAIVTLDSTHTSYSDIFTDGKYKFGISAISSDGWKSSIVMDSAIADGTGPSILTARAFEGDSSITVKFSEQIDPTFANVPANWSISGGLDITSVAPYFDGNGFVAEYYNNGLIAEYYNGQNFDTFVARDTLPNAKMNFSWGNNTSPRSGVNSTNFSIRFTGFILIPQTGAYSFACYADDVARLVIDADTLINFWTGGPTTMNVNANVTSGVHKFICDYVEYTGGAQINLSWTPPNGSQVLIPASNFLLPFPNTVKLFLAAGQRIPLTNNNLSITAKNVRDVYGNENSSQSYSFYPTRTYPNPTITLQAFSPGSGQITLRWSKSKTGDLAVYRIYIYGSTSSNSLIRIDSTSTDTMKIIKGLTNGLTYSFRIIALNSAGLEIAYSNEVSATPTVLPPATPKNLTAIAGNAQVTLKWNKNAETDFLRYRIYKGTTSGGETIVDSSSASITDTVKTLSGLINGIVYYFKIAAMDSARLESGLSNEVSATPYTTVVVSDNAYKIPKTKIAPVIDGQQDAVWKTLNWNMQRIYNVGDPPNYTSAWGTPGATMADSGEGLTGMSKAMWDENNLYILFYNVDDDIVDDPSKPGWNQDGIEIYIDGNNDKTSESSLSGIQHQFTIPHLIKDQEVGHLGYIMSGAPFDTTDVEFKISDVANNQGFPGWMLELKIPLSALGIDGSSAANKLIGWELKQNESDDASAGRQAMSKWWDASDRSWQNGGIWGTAVLSDRVVDTVFEMNKLPAGTVISIDGQMDLVYRYANAMTINVSRVGDPPGADPVDRDPMFGGFITAYPVYDDNNLYLFCDVVDKTIIDIPTNPGWNQDAIEIYIDGTNNKTTETSLKAGQYWFVIPHWLKGEEVGHLGSVFGTYFDTTGIQFKITDHSPRGNDGVLAEEGSGYNVEVKIPLAALGINGSTAGAKLGFELQLDNSSSAIAGRKGMEKWWSSSNNSWVNAAIWGTAKLGPAIGSIPVSTIPAAPTNLVVVAASSSQINLSWTDNSNDEVGFRIEQKTGSSGTYTEITTVGSNTTLYNNTGLSSSTQYYYRVRSYNSAGNSNYSNEVNSTTLSLAIPQNLTADAGNGRVTLKWNKNTEADFLKYRIYMGADSVTMALKDSTVGGVADTVKMIAGLTNGTKYYFRISALNNTRLESGRSIAVSATPIAGPTPPNPLLPVNGASNESTVPMFAWSLVPGVTQYTLQIATDSTSVDSIVFSETITDTTRIVARLSVGCTYFWRVSNGIGLDVGQSSPFARFTVSHLAPLGDYTEDGKVRLEDVVFFIKAWQKKDTLIGDIGPVTGSVPNFQTIYDGKIDFEDLMVLAQMYDWSLAVYPPSFTIAAKSSQKINPNIAIECEQLANDNKKSAAPYLVKLQGVNDAGAIEIIIFFDPKRVQVDTLNSAERLARCFTLKHIDNTKGFASFLVASIDTSKELTNGNEYLKFLATGKARTGRDTLNIMVKAISAQTFASTIAKASFMVDLPVQVPTIFALSQNYPNPFNPSTTIEYQLPKDTRVSLKVYNILGQEIMTVVDEEQKAGYYQINWNGVNNLGTGVSSGVYFIRMRADDYVSSKKIVLIR